jgi:hypothetical protein
LAIGKILKLQNEESGTQAPLEGGSMTLGADFVKRSAAVARSPRPSWSPSALTHR